MNLPVSIGRFHVGMLQGAEGQLTFVYSDEWLSSPEAFPISVRMPLTQAEWGPRIAHRFFANLLPEGQVRQIYCERLGIAYDDDIALLTALGGDTAGALTIGTAEKTHSRKAITESELARFATGSPAIRDGEVLRLSLAGAQHKISVIKSSEEYLWPGVDDASTHILKFDSPHFHGLSVNEHFVLAFARAIHLNVVSAELHLTEMAQFLEVERYDRRVIDGEVHRLHQEDFCQVLGLSHLDKYERNSGPMLGKIAEAIREHSAQPAQDLQAILRWVIFNAYVGNADGHAKNLAFLRTEHGLTLAPFYDLVCTRVFSNVDRSMAFSVGGSRDSDNFAVKHWLGLAEVLKIRPRLVKQEIDRFVGNSSEALHLAQELTESASANSPAIPGLVRVVKKRVRTATNLLKSKSW